MAIEPASSAASAAYAVGAGAVSAGVASLIGVDVATIGWALVGGWFGSAFAPKAGPTATVVQFVFASLISALAATAFAWYWLIKEPVIIHLAAAAISMSFYVLKHALLHRIGIAIDKSLNRIFGSPGDKP